MALKKTGTKAMNFGQIDKTDFLILPFAFFYFYLVFADALGWPTVSTQRFFDSTAIAWIGVGSCLLGLLLVAASLVSFGASFRVGIDTRQPGELVTRGVFALSRNPMYVAFASILVGQFLIFPNWILAAYVGLGSWLFNRQVLREEDDLARRYGSEYDDYRRRTRRYL